MRTREKLVQRRRVLRSLDEHLEYYRRARRAVALRAARHEQPDMSERTEVSFHAIGIAEELDRLAAGGIFP